MSTLYLLVPPLAAHVAAEPRHFGIPSLRMDLLAMCQIMHNWHIFRDQKFWAWAALGVVQDVHVRPDLRSPFCFSSQTLLPV